MSLTCLMLSGIVGNLHGINLQPLRAFTDVVYPGYVGTLLIDHLHHLKIGDDWISGTKFYLNESQ